MEEPTKTYVLRTERQVTPLAIYGEDATPLQRLAVRTLACIRIIWELQHRIEAAQKALGDWERE